MAEFDTIRTAAGARAAEIDEGLRAHMNKVYMTMSVGMLITFLAAWAISGLAVTTDPSAAVGQISATKYLTSFGAAAIPRAAHVAFDLFGSHVPGAIVHGRRAERNCLYMRGNPSVLDVRNGAATFPHRPRKAG